MRSIRQHIGHVLNAIHCVVCRVHEFDKVVNYLVFGIFDLIFQVPPGVGKFHDLVSGIGVTCRPQCLSLLMIHVLQCLVVGNHLSSVPLHIITVFLVDGIVQPVFRQREEIVVQLCLKLTDSDLSIQNSPLNFPPCRRPFLIGFVEISDGIDQFFGVLPQSIGGFLQRTILPLAVGSQLIEVFQVFNPKLIGVSVVLDRKSQVLQGLDSSSNRSIP